MIKKKTISLERFIYSLGIRHIGQENAKLIAKHLKSSNFFFKLSESKNIINLSNIDGIGETQVNSIKAFFSNKTNINVLADLNKHLTILNIVQSNKDGLLKNKTFMLTGKFKNMSRAEAKSLIEKNSGSIVSNVSKKLNYLIIGDKPTKRKVDSAKELKIAILSQEDWLQMLN